MTPQDDIIAAIATPIGEGGISVLRVSGKGSIELCDKKFRKGGTLASAPSHTAHFGEFTGAKGEVIDEVVATVFKAPKSYTGEDTVEDLAGKEHPSVTADLDCLFPRVGFGGLEHSGNDLVDYLTLCTCEFPEVGGM